jgi:hypothetical protein
LASHTRGRYGLSPVGEKAEDFSSGPCERRIQNTWEGSVRQERSEKYLQKLLVTSAFLLPDDSIGIPCYPKYSKEDFCSGKCCAHGEKDFAKDNLLAGADDSKPGGHLHQSNSLMVSPVTCGSPPRRGAGRAIECCASKGRF